MISISRNVVYSLLEPRYNMRFRDFLKMLITLLLLSGCAHIDFTTKSKLNNVCLESKFPFVLYEHVCFLCKTTYGIGYQDAFLDERFFLEYKKRLENLPAGTRIVIKRIERVSGLTDGPPYYIWGSLEEGRYSEIEFHIRFNGNFERAKGNDIKLIENYFNYCSIE